MGTPGGGQPQRGRGAGRAELDPAVSGDGRYVVFQSNLDLAAGDRPGNYYLYLRDRLEGTTRKLLRPDRDQGGLRCDAVEPAIVPDGSTVAFVPDSNSLVSPLGGTRSMEMRNVEPCDGAVVPPGSAVRAVVLQDCLP